jgi:2-polyprenyl-3-methyl-5-hydroxy-6-metoxy-1,4-benzoquinol methylase
MESEFSEMKCGSIDNENLLKEVINCDLCGEDDFKPLFKESGFPFGQCRNCSLYYIRSRPTKESQENIVRDLLFEKSQSSIEEEFLESSLFRKEECSEYLETIEKFVKEGRLLDVGCGIGTLMWFAKKRRWQVEGVELNEYRLEVAMGMNIGKIYSMPVEELNLPQASYDVVTIINVFSHFRSPRQTMMHLMSLIKPKGLLLMRTGEFRDNPAKRDLPPYGLGIPHHLIWNSEKTLELYAKTLDADIVFYRSIPFNEYFVRNKFKYRSKKWYKQSAKILLRNIPGFINLVVSLDNWIKRNNPIYDSTVVYRKR